MLILKLIKKQRKRPEGRPKLDSKIKQKHKLTLQAAIEEISIIETYIKKFERDNKIRLSPSKYIKTIIPYLTVANLAEPLQFKSRRLPTWSFYCNEEDWAYIEKRLKEDFPGMSKNDFLIRAALTGIKFTDIW